MTNTHLDNVAKSMFPKWQRTSNYPLKLFYLSGTVQAMPSRMNISGYVCDLDIVYNIHSSIKKGGVACPN